MNYNEILAKIEDIEHELQELRSMIEVSAQEVSYDPNDFDIEDGILYAYFGNSEEVTIPYGVTKIGNGAFSVNPIIKKVNFPDTVTEIGEAAFCVCENLVEVNNSKNVTKIGKYAFICCSKLEKIDVDNVIEIEYNAFYQCENLKSLIFSDNIKRIGAKAFSDCKNLRISIPNTCNHNAYAFRNCNVVIWRGVYK